MRSPRVGRLRASALACTVAVAAGVAAHPSAHADRAPVPAATTAPVTAAAAVQHGSAASSRAPALVIGATPISTTQAVITVDTRGAELGSDIVRLETPSGAVVADAALTDSGKAVIPVTVKASGTRPLVVTAPGTTVRRAVVASTAPALLATSSWRLVNKVTPAGPTYQPRSLVVGSGVQVDARAAGPMAAMIKAAGTGPTSFYASNGYRAFGWQQGLYGSYVRRDGGLAADAYSARPGYSEHQTGLAFDAKASDGRCALAACFATTPAGRWIKAHAPAYGFVVRYTPVNSVITGYSPEPWHLRYVGTWLTAYLKESGETSLEEALGLPAAPDYIGPNAYAPHP